MPELPEAETIARGLRTPLVGRTIREVEVLHADLLERTPEAFSERVVGGRVTRVARRGKNLVVELEHDAKDDPALSEGSRLVVNLGMSGRLLHRAANDPGEAPSHPGVRFFLDDGGCLVYHDVRRFGRLRVLDPDAYAAWSATLGPEPLSDAFRPTTFFAALQRSRSPLRSFLLDQRRVAGVGNIYANEALFLAGVHPRRPASSLTEAEARCLFDAVRAVLQEAVEARGTTLRDYRTAQGRKGAYANRLRIYGREEQPCPECGSPVRRIVFGGRSAFVCPRCQPPREISA